MVSNLGLRPTSHLDRELARAYGGEIPPPFYRQAPDDAPRIPARHHPGEIVATLPYPTIPGRFTLAYAVSLDELEELVERDARRQEFGGS